MNVSPVAVPRSQFVSPFSDASVWQPMSWLDTQFLASHKFLLKEGDLGESVPRQVVWPFLALGSLAKRVIYCTEQIHAAQTLTLQRQVTGG